MILASTGSEFGLILIPVTTCFGAFISLEASALILILEFPFPSSNYDLKKGKSNKMDITGFQQILERSEHFNEYVEGGRHEIIIDKVGEERYFSLKSNKGKKVLFLDPEKDPYQFMFTDNQFRILRCSQKYNKLKIK